MTKTSTFAAALVTAVLSLAGTTASAVSPYSYYYLNRSNSAGTSLLNIAPASGRFCYLAKVEVDNTDTEGETATCEVRRTGYTWLLYARLGKSSDADVECAAYCYNN